MNKFMLILICFYNNLFDLFDSADVMQYGGETVK